MKRSSRLRRKWMGACLASLFVLGCGASAPPKERYAPSFDYTPPEQAAPGSADVTFALVSPRYAEEIDWIHVSPFTEFARNIGLDFQEVLSARGYTVRGPFETYDEMTFPDKKGSDLVLVPTLDVRVEITNVQLDDRVNLFTGKKTYVPKGDAILSGRVTLSLTESLSNERMWFKSVDIDQRVVVPWVGRLEYAQAPTQVTMQDVDFAEIGPVFGRSLETFYARTVQATWDYLHPEEMALVKKQAQEVKAKKVY